MARYPLLEGRGHVSLHEGRPQNLSLITASPSLVWAFHLTAKQILKVCAGPLYFTVPAIIIVIFTNQIFASLFEARLVPNWDWTLTMYTAVGFNSIIIIIVLIKH